MSTRVVISDAGPLIALAKVGALQILRQLFESVSITSVVLAEILPESADFPEKPLLAQMLNEGWVHILESTRDQGDPPVIGLDPGEASSILAAGALRGQGYRPLLIMDDQAGRRQAAFSGLPVMGTAGVVGLAKSNGLIPAARPVLEAMVRAGYFIGKAHIDAVLKSTGEC